MLTSITVVKTKIELDSHADICAVCDHCLIVHNHNRPVNVYGYNPKAGSKYAYFIDATVAYTVPETGQVVILSINQGIEMKGLKHHLLCLMQCHVNGVLMDEVHDPELDTSPELDPDAASYYLMLIGILR